MTPPKRRSKAGVYAPPNSCPTDLPALRPARLLKPTPFTPSSRAVSRALRFIWHRFNGTPDPEDSGWNILYVTPDEYAELWDILKDTDCGRWAEDKLRYDYDPACHELILRMPSNTHDGFVDGLTQEITKQLEALRASDEKVQDAMGSLDRIMMGFKLPGMREKYPDGAFGPTEIKYPRLVIEIANSQSPKNLEELAYTYIQASKGLIRTVLTIDLEYKPPAKRPQGHKCNAVYSIYRLHVETGLDGRRAKRVKADVKNQPFRHNGNTPDGDLMLKLSDFLGTSHIEQAINPAIAISHTHLTAILARAEERQAIHDSPLSPCCSLDEELYDLPDLTSQRSSSETEELTAEDEVVFQQQEETAEQRADESDGSYQPKARRPRKKRRRA
jgi:hypothetical protein